MNDELMDKYQELSDMTEYPKDYHLMWAELERQFAIHGRPAMADKCKRYATLYAPDELPQT